MHTCTETIGQSVSNSHCAVSIPFEKVSYSSPVLHRYLASVQLATKVIDSEAKLRATLLHELCHVATWVLPPHVAKVPFSATA